MKSALYMGQKNIKMAEVPMPVCGENDILLKNIYASICGTDVAVYMHGPDTGHKVTVGGEFGHEMVSAVSRVGCNVKGINVGDRVYPYPRLVKRDTKRAGTVGGFSEYILAPDAKMDESVYLVPDKISDKTASLIEPFTVGCRAARRSNPRTGEKAIDIFGRASGIHGETADADIFIDAAGAEGLIETYQNMGKIESRLVVVAVLAGLRKINVLDMTYSQHAIIGSGGYMPEDVKDVFAIMQDDRWNIESIITDIFPWEQLLDAIERAEDTANAFNVLIRYEPR